MRIQAVDSRRPMGRITSPQLESGLRVAFLLRFLFFGLVHQRGRARIRGLLFDNLVSDLQFFCQLKTVQAEVLRTQRG